MRYTLAKLTVAAMVTAVGGAALAVSLVPAPEVSEARGATSVIAPIVAAETASNAEPDGALPFIMRGGGFTLHGRLGLVDRAPLGSSDVNGDGVVEDDDALGVLSGWGACTSGPEDCAADIDGNGRVDAADLVQVVARWGSAATERERPRIEDLAAAGLTDADWDRFLGVLESGTAAERRNWLCWMRHFLDARSPESDCPGPDPVSRQRGG